MQPYKVVKKRKKKKMETPNNQEGFRLRISIKPAPNLIEVKEIYIYNRDLKSIALKKQFQVVLRRLFKMAMVCDETTSDGDYKIVLSEIKRAKQVLKDKYAHEKNMKEYRDFFKHLAFLQKEVEDKYIYQKQIREMLYYEQKEERGMRR